MHIYHDKKKTPSVMFLTKLDYITMTLDIILTVKKPDQDSSWLFLGSVRQTQSGNRSQFDSKSLLPDFP